MKPGVMVPGVIGDYNHAATGSDAGVAKALQESKVSDAVELVGLTAKLKSPIPQSHSAKVSDAAPRGSV
jgi:hypothetical protein